MGKLKVNPRRKPVTAEDVKKAYKQGRNEAIEFSIAISCLSVQDIFAPTEEQMQAFHDKYEKNVVAIIDGSIKYADVLDTLKSEYDLEIGFL